MTRRRGGRRLELIWQEYVAIEDGERPPNADQCEAICEFFGWPDVRRTSRGYRIDGLKGLSLA
jgi:DNA-binding XRE family transcriptional regulator